MEYQTVLKSGFSSMDDFNKKLETAKELHAKTPEAQQEVVDSQIKMIESLIEVEKVTTNNIDKIKDLNDVLKMLEERSAKMAKAPEWAIMWTEELGQLNQGFNSIAQTAQLFWDTQQAGWDEDMKNLKNSDEFKRRSKKSQEISIKRLEDKQRSAKEKAWKQQRLLNISQIAMDTATAIMSIYAQVPKFDFGISANILAGIVGAMGATQAGSVASQSMPKFEQGGLIGGRRHSQGGTMIEAESGEFVVNRNAVQSIGLENLNRMNQGEGGGNTVTVNITGNVMSPEYVEGELAEQIKDAVRRGTDFGIS